MANVKYKRNCKICQLSRGNAKLRARIRHAAFHREEGDETLSQIAEDYECSGPAIYNHVKKHMRDTTAGEDARRKLRVAKKTIEFKAKAQKEMELSLDAQTVDEIEARPDEIIGLDAYIAQGVDMIRKGNLKITPSSFLGAVKLKTDWSSKQQNNKLEIMRTMMAFASGGKKGVIDGTAEEVTGSLDPGERQARAIYSRAFGHEIAQGSDGIYQEDEAEQEED